MNLESKVELHLQKQDKPRQFALNCMDELSPIGSKDASENLSTDASLLNK